MLSERPIAPDADLAYAVQELVRKEIHSEADRSAVPDDASWQELRESGSELWLEVDDVEEVGGVCVDPFSGLLTSISAVRREWAEGVYEELLSEAEEVLRDVPRAVRGLEMPFAMIARHALRLVEKFGVHVSVPLHPGLLCNETAAFSYASRLYEISPEFLIVNIPLTPTGIMATRKLRARGVRVNVTGACSARQSYAATVLANPSFVTFSAKSPGRYVSENKWGDGSRVGEKAALASQEEIAAFTLALPQTKTRQVVADIRDPCQLADLAGVDILVLSPPQIRAARQQLSGNWRNRRDAEYAGDPPAGAERAGAALEKLWKIGPPERKFVEQMILHAPSTSEELIEQAHGHGVGDLFPQFSADQQAELREQGSVPRHERWANQIEQGQLAIDSLLSQAAAEQAVAAHGELDKRILPR
jgi:transaldolase